MANLDPNSNYLFYGDNLDVLRRYFPDECVDLVYLDPPFKSNQDYNVLFEEKDGKSSSAQILAFEDTWHWDQSAVAAYQEVLEYGGDAARALKAFRDFLGTNDMMAYLAMMAPRLIELRRVMKPTASIYLHCDPTASHYLKMLMDAVFGGENFRNEIVWKRTSAHSDARRLGAVHDIVLFYSKGAGYTWNQLVVEHDDKYKARFRHSDPDGRLWSDYDLSAKGLTGGGYEYEYKGIKGYWRCPILTMRRYDKEGKLHFTKTGGIRLKRYLDEIPGTSVQSVWTDIPPINSQARERLGYPTQKPEALLERILTMSSNDRDTVLDPFCGCGTTIAAAQNLGRRWIGIDITHLAIALIKHRIMTANGRNVEFKVIGEPVDLSGANELAASNRHQFQWWALGLVGARPHEQKRGADKGIDGILYFHDDKTNGKTKTIMISVKSGHVQVSHIRDLRGVIEREEAHIGVLITLEQPTRDMKIEAADAGFYVSPGISQSKHPIIQILTIDELLSGKRIDLPTTGAGNVTFKRAPKAAAKKKGGETGKIEFS
ncbi:MAG: restriction endonuclease [bacterium]|jgi:DNA modification methylase